MNEQIKQMIVKSIVDRTITEAELEQLEKCTVHELMSIIIQVSGKSGGSLITNTVTYLLNITADYKLSGGSIHEEG